MPVQKSSCRSTDLQKLFHSFWSNQALVEHHGSRDLSEFIAKRTEEVMLTALNALGEECMQLVNRCSGSSASLNKGGRKIDDCDCVTRLNFQ